MTRLIDADALFKDLDGMMEVSPTGYIHGDTVADMINDAPTVEAEPVRHGKWIDTFGNNMKYGFCSLCGDMWENIDTMNYCPNCGAIMDEE